MTRTRGQMYSKQDEEGAEGSDDEKSRRQRGKSGHRDRREEPHKGGRRTTTTSTETETEVLSGLLGGARLRQGFPRGSVRARAQRPST